jgi:hypothetical protein
MGALWSLSKKHCPSHLGRYEWQQVLFSWWIESCSPHMNGLPLPYEGIGSPQERGVIQPHRIGSLAPGNAWWLSISELSVRFEPRVS